jgi:hypothetical protein
VRQPRDLIQQEPSKGEQHRSNIQGSREADKWASSVKEKSQYKQPPQGRNAEERTKRRSLHEEEPAKRRGSLRKEKLPAYRTLEETENLQHYEEERLSEEAPARRTLQSSRELSSRKLGSRKLSSRDLSSPGTERARDTRELKRQRTEKTRRLDSREAEKPRDTKE